MFSVWDLCPVPTLLLFSPLSSTLTKSLFRLDTAENHMVCVTSSGQEAGRGGTVELGRGWLAKSLCSDVSRKALWEATWGVRAEQVGFFLKVLLPPG